MRHSSSQRWRFFRAGGFDQVRLDAGQELLAIDQLDPKLWVALSCPVTGLEFDAKTLAWIDADHDGHIRVPELVAAIQWANAHLTSTELLVAKAPGLRLIDLDTTSDAGQAMAQAAKELLASLGKPTDAVWTVEEASQAQERFVAKALADWADRGQRAQVLGDATATAHEQFKAIEAKIDDYFVRCQLLAYDADVGQAVMPDPDRFKALSAALLTPTQDDFQSMPLAKVQADGALPLAQGVNPAWVLRLGAFQDTVLQPLLASDGARLTDLTPAQWQAVKAAMAVHEQWLSDKPDAASVQAGVSDLEKLTRYVRDLHTLANNFVAFKDFYTRQGKATFQIGTLYLDGRSCELCVAVNDPAKHAALASLSRMFLVYCECVRGGQRMTIAAAMTAGDADQIMVGRNGVFYDRQGRDWDATVVSLVQHPIGLKQAFWSPYKQLGRAVSEQLQKMAATRAKASEDRLASAVMQSAKPVAPAQPAGKPANAPNSAFDVGKFAGIFAAIGLAVGALGTALASVVTGLLALKAWQIPLAVVGIMLSISGPSVVLAWFKLRSRNLGPLLDANGWAINARARINIPFGTSLTGVAQLPPNAERSLTDPYAESPVRWPWYVLALVLVILGAVCYRLGYWAHWLSHGV